MLRIPDTTKQRSMFGHYLRLLPALWHSVFLGACTGGTAFISEHDHTPAAWVSTCKDWDDWNKPGPPYRIFGNSYYVGTCGITAILIIGNEGHILIDGATDAGADIIMQNIKELGYSLNDVELLLHSHEHFDHVGGLAKLQRLSGARLLASTQAAPVLSSGITAGNDPQAGSHKPFAAAQVDGIVRDDDVVRQGNVTLTAISTPGHTPGALSWQWRACDKDHCVSIVYADSLSPISGESYRFSDQPGYVSEYKEGLNKLAELDCQLLVTPHPGASKMRQRLTLAEGLIDTEGCREYATKVSMRLNKRLSSEQENTHEGL